MHYKWAYPIDETIPEYRRSDVFRITEALWNAGFDNCSRLDVFKMWDRYSDSLCAGWIIVPETDEEIIDILVIQGDD